MEGGCEPVAAFYDAIAERYHAIHRDWRSSVEHQGTVLDAVLAAELGAGPKRILDCACGIGTQAIGLALRGHRVSGSDVSAAALERARREAEALGVELETAVADVRSLADVPGAPYDAVLCCDNALAHVQPGDLGSAFASMRGAVRPDGVVLASIRDYEPLVRERPRVQSAVVHGDEGERTVVLQLWDWDADGSAYGMTMLFLREDGPDWRSASETTRLHAHRVETVLAAASAAGLHAARAQTPAESGFHQPIVLGRA